MEHRAALSEGGGRAEELGGMNLSSGVSARLEWIWAGCDAPADLAGRSGHHTHAIAGDDGAGKRCCTGARPPDEQKLGGRATAG